MSPSTVWAILFPDRLREWIQFLLLKLGLQSGPIALNILKGMFDTLLLFFLGLGLLNGSRVYMEGQYALPRATQGMVLKWAPIADHIARKTDIPREVPLVLWLKENSMRAINPDNCTGIIGAYDLVRSGEHPCFTPGPISDVAVAEQLVIGATEFKKRCPDITYLTQDSELIQHCYLAYNAGAGAAARLDPERSAYVMNNYDASYTNMVYSDVELGTVQVTSLGAWPAHLAIQSLIVSQVDGSDKPFSMTLLDLATRFYDWLSYQLSPQALFFGDDRRLEMPLVRSLDLAECLGQAHTFGHISLRPSLNPVGDKPLLTQDIHGCSYGLPGLDISSDNGRALLQAPMPGEVTTYTDRWYNTTIRIENDEWIVWLLHPRSYLVEQGKVRRGQAIGVMGAVGYATGPHVHYAVYDKVSEVFVDPSLFVP
ncbi:MAG: M23 family metallopeptidase [Chloroflexi bacterium]|nr:M23 family metallopeptidase [Chloroflexota bacterium]MCI0580363.1 M23 family metallopeptidase [Chloroflexota bacterium]MCI0649525.1 M23 family metallopeptidase [Chloroflexota bacterium]MCI0726056.1 M23 family metallopeptidase [Chloroflexota bacterium]